MPKTPIANGAEALIVSAREARTYYRSGVIPGGGQRVTVLCHVPANADLADVAQTAGVLGKPDALGARIATLALRFGLTRLSLRERYMVRVERKGRTGKALSPSYKTPLAGTLIPAPPMKAAVPAKAAKPSAPTTAQAPTLQAASQSTASISQGAAAVNKRGQGR